MTQAIDFRFELLFLLCVLILFVGAIALLWLLVRRRWQAAKRLFLLLAAGCTAYLSIVFVVAASTPQLVVARNHDLCFDEMCFAVVDVQSVREMGNNSQRVLANGVFKIIAVRVSSRALGRTQSEQGVRAVLWSPGKQYAISPTGQAAWDALHPQNVTLTARVGAGQSVFSNQVFDVPPYATNLDLALVKGFTPGYFVIGECPLFHHPITLSLSQ